MSLLRAITSDYICCACRRAAIRTPAYTGLSLRRSVSQKANTTHALARRRTFSTSCQLAKEKDDDQYTQDLESSFLEDDPESASASTDSIATEPPSTSSIEHTQATEFTPSSPPEDLSVPWYLRQNSFARDQAQAPIDIPDLPPNPPPLLKTLLEYLSITAGLDGLELLDLRDLDPPPALGPKLIMIIATARSEKHLHVAADRFSRYMRREHGLKANAAGLLGRNELKIKLRRKMKRMRMLSNIGGTMPEGNIDDGIRTGWICCTLSKIEAHPDDVDMPGDDVEGFIGFRDIKPGVNVVVQMFTEQKREETDLETLWGGVLRTQQRQHDRADEKILEMEEYDAEVQKASDVEDQYSAGRFTASPARESDIPTATALTPFMYRPRPTPGDVFPPASNADTGRQLCRLHTAGLR